MLFSPPRMDNRIPLEINAGGEWLEQVTVYKYLGLYLDESLNMEQHIEYLCNNARRKLGMF